jgi:hypothetical protein
MPNPQTTAKNLQDKAQQHLSFTSHGQKARQNRDKVTMRGTRD